MLGHDLTRRLQALAGLRNRLVHLYDEVDDYSVHEALQQGLDDLEGFAHAITTFAARSDGR